MEEKPERKIYRDDVQERKAEAEFETMTATAMKNDPLWATKVPKCKPGDTVTIMGPEGSAVTAVIIKTIAGIYFVNYTDNLGRIFPGVAEEGALNVFD